MGIRFYCPNGHKLNVKEFQAGRKGICPFCGSKTQIPLQSTRPSSKEERTLQKAGPGAMPPAGQATPQMALAGEHAANVRPPEAGPSLPRQPTSLQDTPDAPLKPGPFAPVQSAAPQPAATQAAPLRAAPQGPQPMPAYQPAAYGAAPATSAPAQPAIASAPVQPAIASAPVQPFVSSPVVSAPAGAQAAAPVSAPAAVPASGPAPAAAPAPADPLTEAGDVVWYVRPPSGGQYGPATRDIMRTWLGEGRISPDSLVWREGWRDWQSAGSVFPQLAATSTFPGFAAIADTAAGAHHAAAVRRRSPGSQAAIIALLVTAVLALAGVFLFVLLRGS